MKKTRVLITSILLIIISIALSCSTEKNTVKDALKKIPFDEQQKLSEFFEELLVNQLFGYTIFDDKPFTETSFSTVPNTDELTLKQNSSLIVKRGIVIWKKYKDLFPSKDFVLKFKNEDGVESLFIINIPCFKRNVDKHIDLFKKVLGKNVTADSLLEMIVNQDVSYERALQYNQTLIGILYGFGKHNSLLFDRYNLLSNDLNKETLAPLANNCGDTELENRQLSELLTQTCMSCCNSEKNEFSATIPNVGFNSINEEYKYLEAKLKSSHDLLQTTYLEQVQVPYFRIDPTNGESKEIIHRLMKTKKRVSKICSSGKLLETTLKKITGEG